MHLPTRPMLTVHHPVVEVCSSLDAARAAVAARLAPASAAPADKRPRVVLMGGGFTQDDFVSVYEGAAGAQSVPWIRPAIMKPGAEDRAAIARGPPSAEDVAGRLRTLLEAHLGELREGRGAGEVWWM